MSPPTFDPPPRSRLSWKMMLVIIVAIIAGVSAWIFHRIETWPERTAVRVSKAFAELGHLQPRITIKDRVFFEQTKSVLELAVVSRETQVEREMEHEWLGSKKKMRLRGTYLVKAGFDLTQPFSVRVDGSRIETKLPPPKILSVDSKDIEVTVFENGLWNKISPAELENELRALPNLARQKAGESGLQKEAFDAFTARVRDKFAPDYQVEVKVAQPLD
ncbi:MAG: DUF4230 domain-containing protein [Chthoniobacteraceae bacterium]